MNGIPSDARTRTPDLFEAKTRELPRPVVCRSLPKPWSNSGPGEYSLITRAGAAFVRMSGGEVTVAAADSREVLRSLAELLEWVAWRERSAMPGDKATHSSLYEDLSAR